MEKGRVMVPQVKRYVREHGIELERGWKVEVAKRATSRLLGNKDPTEGVDSLLETW